MLGYSETTKGYRLFDPKKKKLTITRDVTFFESQQSEIDEIREKTPLFFNDIPASSEKQTETSSHETNDGHQEIEQPNTLNDSLPNISTITIQDSDDSFFSDPNVSEDGIEAEDQSEQAERPVRSTRNPTPK